MTVHSTQVGGASGNSCRHLAVTKADVNGYLQHLDVAQEPQIAGEVV
jgi:hypothetical protein